MDYPTRRVYFASRERSAGKSTLWCLDVTAGGATLKWKRALGDIDGSPVLRNGVVYVGTNTGVVYALDADDGDTRWTFATGDGPIKGFVFPDRLDQDLYFSTTTRVWGLTDNGAAAAQKWAAVTSIPSPSYPSIPWAAASSSWEAETEASTRSTTARPASPLRYPSSPR